MKRILLLFAAFATVLTMLAEIDNDVNIDGIYYTLDNSTRTATVINSPSSSYEGDIVIPESMTYDEEDYSVTSIGSNAFQNCKSLVSVNIPESVTSIGAEAFRYCSSLVSVNIPESVTSIGNFAFYYNFKLTEVRIDNPSAWCKINFGYDSNPLQNNNAKLKIKGNPEIITLDNTVTKIPQYAFRGVEIKSIVIPNTVTSIGSCAFSGFSYLTSVEFPASVTNYGSDIFSNSSISVTFNNSTPVDYVFGDNKVFFVPSEAVGAYKAAWPEHATEILAIGTKTDFDVTVEARDNSSDVMDMVNNAANEFDAMLNVVSLKVTGSINSYDIMTMRNKMKNLRILDLSDATVVANSYEYYTGYSSEDDALGANAFRELKKLYSVRIPKVKTLGGSAFYNCNNLKKIVLPDGLVSIGASCFSGCSSLESLDCGKTLEVMGNNAFYYCTMLKTIKFSPVLTTIGGSAFSGCSALTKIELPQTIKTIGGDSFSGCSSLTDIMIPISIEKIGDNAFNTSSIKDIWTWTVKPTNINQNTFKSSIYTTATLHVPNFSKKYYYWDTQWSQFVNLTEFSGEYPFFKLSDDLELGKNDARIQGETDDDGIVTNPDADLASGSGIVVEGDESQNLGEVELKSDGTESASLIGDDSDTDPSGGNINIDCLKIKIDITQNKWYFFAFPFDIPFGSIHFNGQFVWRYYDGEYRSLHGSGAWKNVEGKLLAGRGYIFQASKGGTLTIEVGKVSLNGDDKMIALESHGCENAANASWNLIGNPFTSYYELSDVGIKAPITLWDGNKYQAYSPMDDELTMHPYQAFFVQKPNDAESVDFFANLRETKCQSENPDFRKNVSSRRKARANTSEIREIVNLEISDGTNGDRTRVVFNEAKSFGYELDCDASKFLTSGELQLYTIDNLGTIYAINERPVGDGIVRLGFSAPAPGTYTISSPRMDREMEIVDLKTGEVKALADGYTFTAVAGTDNDRFMLREAGETNGVGNIAADGEGNSVYIGTNGVIYGSEAPTNSVVIRRTGNTVEKLFNK